MDVNNEMNNSENFNEIQSVRRKPSQFLKIYPHGYDEKLDTGEFGRKAHSSPSKSGGFFNEEEELRVVSLKKTFKHFFLQHIFFPPTFRH